MKVYDNIFGGGNVFYINIKNEVYQMKFRHIAIPMDKIVFDGDGEMCFDKKKIQSIEIEVASLGVFKWCHRMYEPPFKPTDIYMNVEDCINKRKSVFITTCGEIRVNGAWCCFFADMEDFAPKNTFLELGRDFYGNAVYRIKAYKWDGLEPKKFSVPTPREFNELVGSNPYECIYFDLSTEEWMIGDDEKIYGSYDECVSDNYIKVHTF